MDTAIFNPTIDIDALENDVINNSKIEAQQITEKINVQIENLKNAKAQQKTIPTSELHLFMKWKTLLLFLIYISNQNISEQKGDIIKAVKQYVNSNGTAPTDFFPYKDHVIEYQIDTIFDIIKILFHGDTIANEFIEKVDKMIESNKILSRKENGVIDKLNGKLKNMYFTLKSDISLVQYKYIEHTLNDLKILINERVKVVEIIHK